MNPLDKPSFANMLKNINLSSNDFFYNENKLYLHNLTNSLEQIVNNLKLIYISDISSTFIKHIQPLCVQSNLDNNLLYFYCENQPEQKQITKLEMEFEGILKNINLLTANIPCYYNMDKSELKIVLNELVVFHNNIINKIKDFLNFTTDYFCQMIKICKFIEQHCEQYKLNLQKIKAKRNNQIFNSIGTIGLELFANSNEHDLVPNNNLLTNTIGIYKQQLAKSSQIEQYEVQLEKLNEYQVHYSKQVKLFTDIKNTGKQIDKTFLLRLQKYISTE